MKAGLFWALGLYITLLGAEELFRGPGLVYLVGGLVFFMFFLNLLQVKVKVRFSWVLLLLATLVVLTLASMLWSTDTDVTLRYSLVLLQLMITTWITIFCLENGSHLEMIAWFLVLSSVAPGLSQVHSFLTGAPTLMLNPGGHTNLGERMTFGGADPNLNAYRFVVSILAAIHLNLTGRSRVLRLLLFGLTGLFVASALLTGSRGGMISLVVSTIVILLANARKRMGTVIVTLLGLTALLALAAPHLPKSLQARYLGIGEEVTNGRMAKRKDIYLEGEASFKRHPLQGVGFFAFGSYSAKHGGLGLIAHNDFLEILLDLGLVGIAVYLLLMLALFRGIMTLGPPELGLALGLFTAYLVSASSIDLLTSKLPWVAFGVILGVRKQKQPATGALPLAWRWWPTRGLATHE